MAIEQGPMSGFRDMLPEQAIPRQEMIGKIREVYEGYGFTPLQTPAIEREDTLTGKYGDEGDKLMYRFEDNGGRAVALRYDHTVPLARVMAQHSTQLPLPYKRYAVGEVWRGESPQAGRYREFTQFDADIVGTKSPMADAEIIAMMVDSMESFGAESLVRVNNRLILDGLSEAVGLESPKDSLWLINSVDKVEKLGAEKVLNSIEERLGLESSNLVAKYLNITGTTADRIKMISSVLGDNASAQEGLANIESVFNLLLSAGYSEDRVVFDQTIARGLDYYTGVIYETTLKEAPELGSVSSGGRFDNLVEDMGGPSMPAVGTSIGVDRLYDALLKTGKLSADKTNTEVLVANFEADEEARYMEIATKLRRLGIATEVFYDPERIGDQLGFANKMKIPYVVLIGPNELERGIAIIKSMDSREQQEVELIDLPNAISQMRND